MSGGSNSNALVSLSGTDVAGIGKTFEALKDKIRFFTPTEEIVPRAKAKAEAKIIKAKTANEIRTMKAVAFRDSQALQDFNNVESTLEKAKEFLKEDAKLEDANDDTLRNIIDKARLISDKEMQTLWAKILAGEVNKPGDFTTRTINLAANFDKEDIMLFTNLCSFVLGNTIFIYDYNNSIYLNKNISFATLLHLEDIGLISFNHISQYIVTFHNPQTDLISLEYFGEIKTIKVSDNQLNVGSVKFTKAGEQLMKICDVQKCEYFFEYLEQEWKKLGYIVTIRL